MNPKRYLSAWSKLTLSAQGSVSSLGGRISSAKPTSSPPKTDQELLRLENRWEKLLADTEQEVGITWVDAEQIHKSRQNHGHETDTENELRILVQYSGVKRGDAAAREDVNSDRIKYVRQKHQRDTLYGKTKTDLHPKHLQTCPVCARAEQVDGLAEAA